MPCNESQPSKSVEGEAVSVEPQWLPIVGFDPAIRDEQDRILTAVYESNGIALRLRVTPA